MKNSCYCGRNTKNILLYNIYPIVYKMLYRNNKIVRSNNKMNDSIWISILYFFFFFIFFPNFIAICIFKCTNK